MGIFDGASSAVSNMLSSIELLPFQRNSFIYSQILCEVTLN